MGYWDQSKVEVNIAKQMNPLIGKIVSCARMVGPNAPGETCNIVIDHAGKLPYWEGQSYGVLPPGIDPKKNKPYGVRLYSIASTRHGTSRTARPPPSAFAAPLTGAPSSRPTTPPRRASAPTTFATPSPAMRSSLPAPPAR